jgi:3-oxoacyl-[acyl-carrier-protein] synthase II
MVRDFKAAIKMQTLLKLKQDSQQAIVTAAAVVTALGPGLDDLWAGLLGRETAIQPISRFPVEQDHYRSKAAAIIDDLNPRPGRSLMTDLLDRLADQLNAIPEDAALMTATIKSGIDNLESECRGSAAGMQDILLTSLADRLGARLGLTDRGVCISASCASSTIAVARGAALIAMGRADAVLVCCADIVSEYAFSGFSALKALAPDACRPFDRNRQGLSLGEGAAALLLMSKARAQKEGRDRLGSIRGWGITNDASHITAPVRGGAGLARAIDKALAAAGRTADDIAAVCAHGTGTIYNDRMELDAFNTVFHGRPLPIFSVKGAIGHTLGAAGGIETALGLKALATHIVPPTVGFAAPEKGAEGQVSGNQQAIAGDVLLTTNSGFGGINAALVLGR